MVSGCLIDSDMVHMSACLHRTVSCARGKARMRLKSSDASVVGLRQGQSRLRLRFVVRWPFVRSCPEGCRKVFLSPCLEFKGQRKAQDRAGYKRFIPSGRASVASETASRARYLRGKLSLIGA